MELAAMTPSHLPPNVREVYIIHAQALKAQE